MNIFINNQEVVCSRNMQIKESLANTNSVILNNVYPKEWETDKDYTSRFYMPEDYSHCVIKNTDNTYYRNSARWFYWNAKYPDPTTNKITLLAGTSMIWIPVVKGIRYELDLNSTYENAMSIFAGDNADTGSDVVDTGVKIQPGYNKIFIVPEMKNLFIQRASTNLELKIIPSFVGTNDKTIPYDLKDNVILKDNRLLVGETSIIKYSTIYSIRYMKVVPNVTYTLRVRSTASTTRYICEADSVDIGTQATRLEQIYYTGTGGVVITPTKDYIVVDSAIDILDIYYYAPTNLVFSGIVKNSGNINLNPRYPHYATLQLLDYKALLSEGETLNYVLEKQSISSALKRIVRDLDSFYIGTISMVSDDIIEAYNCNEKTPYDVLEYLAEVTGAVWYTQTIGEDITLINFYSIDNLPMADILEYTQEYFSDNMIQDIQYSYSANDYRNKQIITTDKAVANRTQTEMLTYNGIDLKTSMDINTIETITINDVSYSVASNIAKKNGMYAAFYYTYGSNDIDINTELGTGVVLKVTYYPLVNSRQVAYNQDEIDRININTGRTGVISRYEKRTDTSDEQALSQIAQTYIDYKSVPEVTIKVQSYNKDIYELGNRVFFDGPIEQLKTNYLVKEKQIDMITTGEQQELFYTYTLSSSFNDKNAINFFDNQRRKLEGNIEERTIHNTL